MTDTGGEIRVRAYEPSRDERWASVLLDDALAGRLQARRGEVIDVLAGRGFVAERGGEPVGLLGYRFDGEGCEVTVLVSREEGVGVGTALLAAVVGRVTGRASRLWLVTTNDNLGALGFYQRRGFVLRALRPGAVSDTRRRLKPTIPETGDEGIPIRDELELELPLPG